MHPLHPELNCIKHMGWLYYVKQEMVSVKNREYEDGTEVIQGFLYRVREDGTENQQITNVLMHSEAITEASINDGWLHFIDSEGKDRIIRTENDFEDTNCEEWDKVKTQKIGERVYVMYPLCPGKNCFRRYGCGWLYYVNLERKDFLYRVREDGTENQQITNFSVNRYCIRHVRLEDGYLCFSDGQREIFVQDTVD